MVNLKGGRANGRILTLSISLFGSQRLHRIEARCTPRGDKTCECRHCKQHCGNYGKNRRIEWLDLIEQVTYQSAGFQACAESHGETEAAAALLGRAGMRGRARMA